MFDPSKVELDSVKVKKLPIVEIFDSIQGEGTFMGTPATFIRLAGCNLECPWCDTADRNTVNEKLLAKDIVARCNMEVVVITGGEPCLQELDELIELLKDEGHYVCIETNGTMPTPVQADWVTCSPKPETTYTIDEDCRYDELKYVVDDCFYPELVPNNTQGKTVWLQPEGSSLKTSVKRAYKMVMANPDKFLLGAQLHKLYKLK